MNRVAIPYQPDSVALFERLRDLPHAVFLHSSERSSPAARHDVMAAEPVREIVYQNGVLRVGDLRIATARPFDALRAQFPGNGAAPSSHFRSGFIGYFGYGLQHTLERLPASPPDGVGLPMLYGGDYRWSVVTDHVARTTELWHEAEVSSVDAGRIVSKLTGEPTASAGDFAIDRRFTSSTTDRAYLEAFDTIQRHLSAGECYQVNLARHYVAALHGDRRNASWTAYKRLVALQPAPFGAYLATPYGDVVCLSPERFVKHIGGRLETSPIKGTAPRHRAEADDRASRERLCRSAKDRAENLMIVDLLRNDLGRICRPGSIGVSELFRIESFASVHHMISTIRGETVPDVDAWDVLTAVFPGGSITGAPKIRAMEIINELEPVARSIYCGSIGYVDRSGAMDTNIAIRTLAFTATGVHCWGGGGVVADSVASLELAEIEHKIGRLLQATSALGTSKSCSAS